MHQAIGKTLPKCIFNKKHSKTNVVSITLASHLWFLESTPAFDATRNWQISTWPRSEAKWRGVCSLQNDVNKSLKMKRDKGAIQWNFRENGVNRGNASYNLSREWILAFDATRNWQAWNEPFAEAECRGVCLLKHPRITSLEMFTLPCKTRISKNKTKRGLNVAHIIFRIYVSFGQNEKLANLDVANNRSFMKSSPTTEDQREINRWI